VRSAESVRDAQIARQTSVSAHFRAAYADALDAYLRDRGEHSLRPAYELGRDAVERRLSVLELAAVHHEVLIAALCRCSGTDEIEQVTRFAADFLLESLSAFEMIQRGFGEAHEAAVVERRHAEMLRRLSSLLADASLAFGASDSLEEMLQLVAEQARELTNARYCLANAEIAVVGGGIEVASFDDPADARWSRVLESIEATSVLPRLRNARAPVRMTRAELADAPAPLPGWLYAPLNALDGRELGAIHLVDKPNGDFTELDEAVVVHLAQMAAGALERALLYKRR
jgi:hypothetical protein